jgi:hypothetical protein
LASDLFLTDIQTLQKQGAQLQILNIFRTTGTWPSNLPKSEANYLQNFAPKLFQDHNKIVWICLDNYKYPALPEKYRKMALSKAHNH